MKLLKNLFLMTMVMTLTGCDGGTPAKKLVKSGRDKNPSGTEITAADLDEVFENYIEEVNKQKVITEYIFADYKTTSIDNAEDADYYKNEATYTIDGFQTTNLNKPESYMKLITKGKGKTQKDKNSKLVNITSTEKNELYGNDKNDYRKDSSSTDYSDGSYKRVSESKSCYEAGYYNDGWEEQDFSESLFGLFEELPPFYNPKVKILKKGSNTYYITGVLGKDDAPSEYTRFSYDFYVKLVFNSNGLLTSGYVDYIADATIQHSDLTTETSTAKVKTGLSVEYKAKTFKFDTAKGYSCPKE